MRTRILHLQVLAALGVACSPTTSFGLDRPDALTLSALDGSCPAQPRARSVLDFPVTFEPNRGQRRAPGAFLARGPMRELALTPTGPVLTLVDGRGATAALRIVDGDTHAAAAPECLTPTISHHFVGSPDQWQRDLPNFARVRFENVRPQVDFAYYGRDGAVEYDIIARPGADVAALAFEVESTGYPTVDAEGRLVIRTDAGDVVHQRPVAYQLAADGTVEVVAASYALTHDAESDAWRLGFDLGAYDAGRTLVIDPVLMYSSYLGASGANGGGGGYLAVDAASNIFHAGSFTIAGQADIEVRKFDPATNTLLYSAVLGGSGFDSVAAMAVDAAGNTYLAGATSSGNFPRCLAVSDCRAHQGSNDAYAMRLDATLTPTYSMLMGGSGSDNALAIAVESSGAIVFAGQTQSLNFPLQNPLQASYLGSSGSPEAFVTRLDTGPTGGITFSTYLGSSGSESAQAVVVDGAGMILVGGSTDNVTFPGGIGHVHAGSTDGFILKIDPVVPAILQSMYLGGSGADFVRALAFDPVSGELLVGGQAGVGLPTTPNAAQPNLFFNLDGFVARYSAAGTLQYLSYLGGSGFDSVRTVAPDGLGGFFAAGTAGAAAFFPTVSQISGVLTGPSTDSASYLAHFTRAGALDFSSLLGGSGGEGTNSMVVAPDSTIWVGGATAARDFPMLNAQRTLFQGSSSDYFGYRIGFNDIAAETVIDSGPVGTVSSPEAAFTFSSPNIGAIYQCSLDGAPFAPCASPKSYAPLGNGPHTFLVRSHSLSGIDATPASRTWTVATSVSAARTSDFSGDGRSDVLWRNAGGGEMYQWQMNGIAVGTQGYLPSVPGGWSVVGLGDLNADGRADVLWREASAGLNYFWRMDGLAILEQGFLPAVPSPWTVAGMGDADGDSRADIFWRNPSTGDNYLWLMNGGALTGQGYLPNVPGVDWEMAAIARFGGGNAGVFWRHKVSGQNYMWQMGGLTVTLQGFLPPVSDPDWEVAGAPDLDGDGRADVVWRNKANGSNYAWLMNGLSVVGQGFLPAIADLGWKIVGHGDYDGDGRGDVLWRHATSGLNYVWLMNGLAISSQGYLPSVPSAWAVQR